MRNLITKIYYPATNTHVWFRNGRRLKTMDKKFEAILRTGKTIDMLSEIENLQETYYLNLQSSVDCFDTYDEVSDETREDYSKVYAILEAYKRLGYISQDEFQDMVEAAAEQRNTVLKALEDKE